MKQYVVKQSDVNKGAGASVQISCKHCESVTVEYPFKPLGRVIPADVGKICKKVNDCWYVENQQQFEDRINKKRK